MALIRTSPILTSIAGSIASQTYQTAQGGLTVKTRRPPKTTQAPLQLIHQELVRVLAAGWSSLSQAERSAWNAFAERTPYEHADGRLVRLSGYNYYIQVNIHRRHAGAPRLTVPPPGGTVPAMVPLVWVALTSSDLLIAYITRPADFGDSYTGATWALYGSGWHRRGLMRPRGPWRIIRSLGTPDGGKVEGGVEAYTTWPTPPGYGRCFLRWRWQDRLGRFSPWSSATVDDPTA